MSKFTGTVLVTGGTVGLGYQAALQIAKKHPDYFLVLASRTDPDSAPAALNKATGRTCAVFLPLDLSSLAKIRSFAAEYAKKDYPPIRSLMLNAGLQITQGVKYTTDGYEMTFGVNHLGHALLFFLLRPYLADNARIVLTASGTHDPDIKTLVAPAKYTTAEELAHPTEETKKNDGRQRYGTSKLLNVMWSLALARRLNGRHSDASHNKDQNWATLTFDPGLMPGTGMARDTPPVLRFVWLHVLPHLIPLMRLAITPNIHKTKESGASLARVAVGDDVEGLNGVYFSGPTQIKSSVASYNEEKQDDLWEWTINAIATNENEKRSFENVYLST